MIPGIDGVGRRTDGKRVYFVADDHVIGTMADKAVVDGAVPSSCPTTSTWPRWPPP